MKDQLLQQSQQLKWNIGSNESLNSSRHLINVLGVSESLDDVIDEEFSMNVCGLENNCPKFLWLTFNEIFSLNSVHFILIGEGDQLFVAVSPSVTIGEYSQLSISLFTELTNNLGIIELIWLEELPRVLRGIDLDLGQSVMDLWDLVSLLHSLIEPVLQHAEFVSLLELLDGGLDGAQSSDVVQQLADVGFFGFEVNEGSQHLRGGLGVHFEDVDFDVFVEIVGEEVPGQLIHISVDIAQEDQRTRVWDSLLLEEVLDLLGIIAVLLLSDDSFEFLYLVAFSCCLNVLVINLLIVSGVDERSQEQEYSLEWTHWLKDLHQSRNGQSLIVLDCNAYNQLDILSVVLQ